MDLKTWESEENELLRRIRAWGRAYKHRNPCSQYVKTGFCMHMARAQAKKFGGEISSNLLNLASLKRA